MNEHIELLVATKPKMVFNVGKILLWIVTVLSVLVFMTGMLGFIPIIIAVAAGFGAYYLGLRADVEYEDYEGNKLDRKLLELLQRH